MKRKLVKNKHQYKLNIPIELVRKLELSNSVIIKEALTSEGPGIVILKDKRDVMEVKDGFD